MFRTDVESDILGKQNGFRRITKALAARTVKENKWPVMILTISREQSALLKKQNKKGEMLLHLLCDAEDQTGTYPPIVAVYRYLIKNYLCYVEVPQERLNRDTNQKVPSFQKRTITANMDIIAEWMGMTRSEADKKYGSHFADLDNPTDAEEYSIPFLELRETKDREHKITKPRKKLDLTIPKLAVHPLYMLKEAMDTLYTEMQEDVCCIRYLKDNNITRTIYTTVNKGIQAEIYGEDSTWYEESLRNTYRNDFLTNDTLFRGYVRIPEIGGSKYDSPTRSLNYARILEIQPHAKPDLDYINIDLATTQQAFYHYLTTYPENTREVRDRLQGTQYGKGIQTTANIILWEENMELMYTTEFRRFIGKFMLDNPDLFPDYTGKPIVQAQNKGLGIGLEASEGIDIEDDDLFAML